MKEIMSSRGDNKQYRQVLHLRKFRTWAFFKEIQFAHLFRCSTTLPSKSPVELIGTGPPHCTKRGLYTKQHATNRNYSREPISGRPPPFSTSCCVRIHSIGRFPHGICREYWHATSFPEQPRIGGKIGDRKSRDLLVTKPPPQPPLAFNSFHITSSIPQTYLHKLSRG